MFDSAKRLEKKRDDIIMACLNGGQHIDAALEAADRLVPLSSIEDARQEDETMGLKFFENLRQKYNQEAIESLSTAPKKQRWWEELVEKLASLGRL